MGLGEACQCKVVVSSGFSLQIYGANAFFWITIIKLAICGSAFAVTIYYLTHVYKEA